MLAWSVRAARTEVCVHAVAADRRMSRAISKAGASQRGPSPRRLTSSSLKMAISATDPGASQKSHAWVSIARSSSFILSLCPNQMGTHINVSLARVEA